MADRRKLSESERRWLKNAPTLLQRAGGSLGVDPEALARLSGADRDAVLAELKALELAFRRNPLLGYRPHPKQERFHAAVGLDLRAYFGGNRAGKCLHEDERVRMADGSTRAIRDVRLGEWVVGVSTDGSTRPARVIGRFDNGMKPVNRYWFGKRGEETSFVATAEHKMLARHEKGTVRVLPAGEVAAERTRSRWSAQRTIGFDVLSPGRDEEYALLFGLLLGDGCVRQGRIQFTCADPDIEDLAASAFEAQGYAFRRNPANDIQFTATMRPKRQSSVLLAQANHLLTALRRHDLECSSEFKAIPACVETWSTPAVARLVAGLLLTDGSVFPQAGAWRVGFTSTSRRLADGLRSLLETRFGVYGGTVRTQHREGRKPEYYFTIGNFHSLCRLRDAIPLVGAKRDKLRDGLVAWQGKQSDGARLRYRRVEPLGIAQTYDIWIDHPTHLFALENGLAVSNTTGTMVDTIIQAVDEEVIPEHLKAFKFWSPPFYCRVVTPDLSNTMEGVVLQKFREWTPKDQFRGGNFDRAWDKTLRMLHFKNGSWIQFFSNDQDLDKFGGAALHRVVYDEEPRREIRNECRMRLIDYGGDELFGMTPLLGMSFIYEEVFEPWQRGDLPQDSVVVVDMEDNPHLAQGEIERALSGFSSEERQARKSGRFVHFEGLVFPEWSEHKHVIPTLEELPEHVECWAGIDPGIRHMAAVVFCFIDQQDCLVVYDEIAVQGKTIREVCDAIHLVNARWNAKPRWYVIDPASRNKNHQTGRSDQQEYIDHGVVALPGQNSVTAGINRIKERLEVDKLLVMAHCRELRREFTRYRWSKPKRMEGDPREQPVKMDDHLLDALRYVAMSRPLPPRPMKPAQTFTQKDRLLRAALDQFKTGKPIDHPSGDGLFA